MIKKVNNAMPWKYAIEDLIGKTFFGKYCKKEIQNTSQTDLNYMSNGKAMVIHGTFGLIKKISLYKMNYFHNKKTYSHNNNKKKMN